MFGLEIKTHPAQASHAAEQAIAGELFVQAQNGLFVRMALLSLLLEGEL